MYSENMVEVDESQKKTFTGVQTKVWSHILARPGSEYRTSLADRLPCTPTNPYR